MKHYLVWLSSKGGKELYTVVDNELLANTMADYMNKFYKEHERKARAYITLCEDGAPYYHKEIKKEGV